ncbi:MAG: prolipoprotein diacylglyceryl transferase [Patescibacteria group bacterium]|nr:prolipoprotein diacylglyceryl transferase [Patescibacteria group bacterium]
MIPYFEFTGVQFGPVHLQSWGFFVALGILAALVVGQREARRRGLTGDLFVDFATWAVIGGIVGGRLFYALFYAPAVFLSHPFFIIRIWDGGMSIFGGFLGAALTGWLALRREDSMTRSSVFNSAAYALPLGCAIGRLGCFLIHDHPGIKSDFFLAVAYPGGGRFDHGLLLSLLNALIFLGFWLWRRRSRALPPFLAAYAVAYGVSRFGLDFLRAHDLVSSDTRYFGLTPAQYLSVLIVAFGIWLWHRQTARHIGY